MSPEYVRPYVKAQKNDDRDAEAIAEAAIRPTMRFVEVKSEVQSDLQALHRARERLVAERTALINHLRAVLLERGIVMAQGRRKLEKQLPGILADEALGLSPRIRRLIGDLRDEWRVLDERIAAFDAEFVPMARTDEAAAAADVDPRDRHDQRDSAWWPRWAMRRAFRRGRDMAAWLGLAPRQATTGGKPRLLGISKRGNRYLRKNLIHGARAGAAVSRRARHAARPVGDGAYWRELTRTSWSWRWPTSWRASPGRCWRAAAAFDAAARGGCIEEECPNGVDQRRRVAEGLRWWKEDGLTVERQHENLTPLNGPRGRC